MVEMSATSFIREAFKPYLITGICSNYQDDKRNDKMNCGFICYLFIIVSCVKDINIHLFTSIRSLLICFSESRWVQTDVDSYWSDVLCADPPYLLLPQVENTHTHTHTHLPRIQYIQPVFWCNRDVSLSIKLKMCFQMERERTGLLHGQQDQVGRWHLQQI